MSESLTVKVYPFREKVGMGNIIWAERTEGNSYYRTSKYAMRGGKFPTNHPVGGGASVTDSQCGSSYPMHVFRGRGYWASCFPEGDGITWKPLNGQSDEQCLKDIRESFGWNADWAEGVVL